MDQSFQIKLIDGEYSAEDAREVLHRLIMDKIKFHNLQLLAGKERNHQDIYHSEKRIEELKQSLEHIDQMIEKKQDTKIRMKSDINIYFSPYVENKENS